MPLAEFPFLKHHRQQVDAVELVTDTGDPEPKRLAPGADLRTDLPRYAVYRAGERRDDVTDIADLWADDLVAIIESDFIEDGELFSTAADAEALITRPKDQMDNPLPSGSSLAAEAFLVRSLYTGQDQAAFEAAVREAGALFQQFPTAAAHMLGLVASRELGLVEVAVAGPSAAEWARSFWGEFRHNCVLAVDDTDALSAIPLMSGRWSDTQTRAFLCRGFVCDLPAESAEAFEQQLGQMAG